MKKWLALTLVLPVLVFAGDKVTICHATSSAENPWNEITTSVNAIGAHFEENGTPKAGHEKDLLLEDGQHCPGVIVPPPVDPPQDPGTTTPPIIDPIVPPVDATSTPLTDPIDPGSTSVSSGSTSGGYSNGGPYVQGKVLGETVEMPVGAPLTGGGWASSFWGRVYSFIVFRGII